MNSDNKRYNVIGKSAPRIDGYDKVTGKARYAADIYMDGMLYAGALKSGYVSAKVLSINTEKAKQIEGVVCVLTYDEIPKKQSFGSYMFLTDIILPVTHLLLSYSAILSESIHNKWLSIFLSRLPERLKNE